MKYKIIASCLVIIVSAFSFSYGDAQVAHTTHAGSVIPGLTTNLQTTTVGSTNWVSDLTVPSGTATSWLLSYKNDTTTQIPKVVIRAVMPLNHTLVPGSVMLFDANFPSGYVLPDTGLFNEGIDIGAVNPGINGFIRFRAVLDANTPCGIRSSASGSFEAGTQTAQHQATVITPACTEATPTPAPVTPPTANAPTTTHNEHGLSQPTSTVNSAQTTSMVASETQINSTQPTQTQATQSTVTSHDSTHQSEQQATPTTTQTSISQSVQSQVTTTQTATHTENHAQTTAPATTSSQTTSAQTTSQHNAHAATPVVSGASTNKTTTSPAPTPTQHSAHSTLPRTGGNPFWVITGAFSLGYLVRLLFLRRQLSIQQG